MRIELEKSLVFDIEYDFNEVKNFVDYWKNSIFLFGNFRIYGKDNQTAAILELKKHRFDSDVDVIGEYWDLKWHFGTLHFDNKAARDMFLNWFSHNRSEFWKLFFKNAFVEAENFVALKNKFEW